MKSFINIILIFFALVSVHSDGHVSISTSTSPSPDTGSSSSKINTLNTININDINNIASSRNYTKNVFNSNDSFSTFIVTPVAVFPTSSSSLVKLPASTITTLTPSTLSTTTPTSVANEGDDHASVSSTEATDASTSRDKRGTNANFGLDQSEIARQNQITQQILSNYLERRLFPNLGNSQKIPTIAEILPKQTTTTTSRPRSSIQRSRPRGFSVSSPSFKKGSTASSLRKTYGQRKTPNSLQQLLKYKNNTRKQNENENENEREPDANKDEDYEDEIDYDASTEADDEENSNNKTVISKHGLHHALRDDLDEEAEYEEPIHYRPRYRPYQRYRHHHTNHRHYDDDIEQDGQESLQSVESEQHDHYYKTKGDIFSRDPSENEIDSDCPHCVDEMQYMNKWTMPLLKLGEKRYYLGIFFKANWFKATQYCRYHGMHLASISSQEENDRLEKHIKDFGLGHEHFWISGTDLADEGTFFWMSTGRPITFTNWNAGEPNNFRYENGEEENCMELWNRDGKGLKWNDSPCSFETYFVCEVQP